MWGAPALPGGRVGVQRPADCQAARVDRLDAKQVAVGQRPARLPCLDRLVVLRADDQISSAGGSSVGDADLGPGGDDAQADEIVADAAGQLAAQRVIGGHQQHIGALHS